MAGDTVDQIKERLSILDVVAPYVELHKAGKSYKGKSPFTNERTPSFFVSPDRGMYYCFSSNQGGDIFTFIQTMEGVDFKGALKILAERAGVELVREDPKKRSERDRQYAMLEAATAYFVRRLDDDESDALTYLHDRGLTNTTIAAWQIGYAPGPPHHGWRELAAHLAEAGYTNDEAITVGLLKPGTDGKDPYDLFRDRIVFPMNDASGRTIAFSGRILHPNDKAPKYVNSPETPLYHKSNTLFGYDRAKQGIRKLDFALIVEGQFDVVLAHQTGYTNTVAVSGTALTASHVDLLTRLSSRVVLALDADSAGVRAVQHAAELMLTRGIDVKVAQLPDGEDPADIIADDASRFKACIASSMHVIDFLLAVLKQNARDSRTYALSVRDEVLPYLIRLQSDIEREHFIGQVATALRVEANAVRLDLARIMRADDTSHQSTDVSKAAPPEHDASHTSQNQSRLERLSAYLVVLMECIPDRERAVVATAVGEIDDTLVERASSALDERERARLVFATEEQIDALSDNQRRTLLAETVTELRTLIARERIRTLRDALQSKEGVDAGDTDELLREIATAQQLLSAEPYSVEDFT